MKRVLLTVVATSVGLAVGGCGGSEVESGSLPVHEDFGECSGFPSKDEVATVDCPDGVLRILVSDPSVSAAHSVPFRFDKPPAGLAVEADVRATKGASAHGLGCSAAGAAEPERAYLFLTVRGVGDSKVDGGVVIAKLDASKQEALQELREESNAIVGEGGHSLRAVCELSPDGTVDLTMIADGKTVARARDKNGIGPFRAVLVNVIAFDPGSEVVFDNLSARDTDS